MKKVSLGLAFILLISFQASNAADSTSNDACKAMLEECNPHVNVTENAELCNTCFEKCDKTKAKDVCLKSIDKNIAKKRIEAISANYRLCANACGNPPQPKEKKISK